MKLSTCIFMCCLGLSSVFLTHPLVAAEDRPIVSSVSFHPENAQKEKVRIKLEGSHSPQVYPMDGDKPRLVVDFPGAGYAGLVKPMVKANNTLVKGIRVGVHGQPAPKTRVVLDLEPGRKYTYSREFVKAENVLNVILVPTVAGKKAEVPIVTIKKTEMPIVKINAKETKQVSDSSTKKSASPNIAISAPPPAAQKTAIEHALPLESAKTVPAVSGPLPAQKVKETEAVASASAPAPKVEPVVTAEPAIQEAVKPAAEPAETSKPADDVVARQEEKMPAAPPAEVEKKEEGVIPPAEKPEATTTVAAQKPGPESEPVAALPKKADAPVQAQAEEPVLPDPLLLDITYENNSSKGEMIFFRLNGFFPPSVSAVESDNPEVICDFANTRQKGNIKSVIETKGAYVQKILTGKDPKKFRVTLQLTPGRDYDLRQVFFKEDNLFVLVVNAMDEESVDNAAKDEKQ